MKDIRKNIEILYEDNHILAAVKPPGVLSQGDRTGDPDMLGILKEDIRQRHNKPGNVYLGLVHRLDRPVGGVMVFAKTSKAASRLSDQMRQGKFEKTYLAILKGVPPEIEGIFEHFFIKDRGKNKAITVAGGDEGGKRALLKYSVLESKKGMSLVQIDLLTGRPHQIRAQFAEEGYPLVGDVKYGGWARGEKMDIALWSYSVSFLHPVRREPAAFECPPPGGFPWDLF